MRFRVVDGRWDIESALLCDERKSEDEADAGGVRGGWKICDFAPDILGGAP